VNSATATRDQFTQEHAEALHPAPGSDQPPTHATVRRGFTEEQRAAGQLKAGQTRAELAEIRNQVSRGEMGWAQLLERAQGKDVAGTLKVGLALRSLPGVGPVHPSEYSPTSTSTPTVACVALANASARRWRTPSPHHSPDLQPMPRPRRRDGGSA